eukprot:5806310-Amphidinium_carterae.1
MHPDRTTTSVPIVQLIMSMYDLLTWTGVRSVCGSCRRQALQADVEGNVSSHSIERDYVPGLTSVNVLKSNSFPQS